MRSTAGPADNLRETTCKEGVGVWGANYSTGQGSLVTCGVQYHCVDTEQTGKLLENLQRTMKDATSCPAELQDPLPKILTEEGLKPETLNPGVVPQARSSRPRACGDAAVKVLAESCRVA